MFAVDSLENTTITLEQEGAAATTANAPTYEFAFDLGLGSLVDMDMFQYDPSTVSQDSGVGFTQE